MLLFDCRSQYNLRLISILISFFHAHIIIICDTRVGLCDGRVVIMRSSISGKLMSKGIVYIHQVASDGTPTAATPLAWSGDESKTYSMPCSCVFLRLVRTLGKAKFCMVPIS